MKNIAPNNIDALAWRVSLGDEAAFRQLFREYGNNVYSVACIMTKSAAMAEDLVQDIFLKLWLNRTALSTVQDLRAYIFITARNHILNELRKKMNDSSFTQFLLDHFTHTEETPEQALIRKESRSCLQKAIAHLPAQQRLIYTLSREQGLKQDEIASRLNISKHTVRNHMAQALLNIRHYLEHSATGLVLAVCLLEAAS